MGKYSKIALAGVLAIAIIVIGVMVLTETAETKTPVTRQVATFETNMGTIKIELYNDLAPKTVKNFTDLIEKGYYDGLIFHRVIDNFMIQGGCPQGSGMGGPGYTIDDEFGKGLEHKGAGILSMANAGPNTGGSQFFITLVDCPWLDGKHAIFGHVIEGLDIVQAIGKVPTDSFDRPLKKVVMEKLTVK
ncbi:MAG: peptidylprolyl isomerase [Synergistaceae bacterium]